MRAFRTPMRVLLVVLVLAVIGGVVLLRGRSPKRPPHTPGAYAAGTAQELAAKATAAMSPKEAKGIVAKYLEVRPEAVVTEGIKPRNGKVVISAKVPTEVSAQERVQIKIHPAAKYLRGVSWLDREESGPIKVSIEEAEATAEKLFKRWFPQVPVRMVRRDSKILAMPTIVVSWQGRVADHVYTGDHATAMISAVTGLPKLYGQRVAWHRPKPEDILITCEQAIDIAERERAARYSAEWTVAQIETRLVLSALLSADEGPVWFVTFKFVQHPEMECLPGEQIYIDAMSGAVID